MPREMPDVMIREIIAGFASAAQMMQDVGYDGVEIVDSHGYLPAQFLNPSVNLHDDDWGGGFERRLRFTQEAARTIRAAAPSLAVGLRCRGMKKTGWVWMALQW